MERKRVTGIIQTYSKKARDQISRIGWEILEEAEVTQYSEDIFSCVDEIIKNAVKSNYKFLLLFNRIRSGIMRDNPEMDDEEYKKTVYDLLMNREKFDTIVVKIISEEDISSLVREILNEEAKYLSIKNRVYEDSRDYTDEEKKIVAGLRKLKEIKSSMKDNDIKILVKYEYDGDFIYIEITNTAPITSVDLKRIYDKRDEYRKFRLAGREYEFFINNIDTSESGFGFGYAKIDSHLANMGLDSESSVTIISAKNTTVMLTLPLSILRKQPVHSG